MPPISADVAAIACTNRHSVERTTLRFVVSRLERWNRPSQRNLRRGYGHCAALERFRPGRANGNVLAEGDPGSKATAAANEIGGSRRN